MSPIIFRLQDSETKQMKLNYNNIDILELEVPQNQQLVCFDSNIFCKWLRITESDLFFFFEVWLKIAPLRKFTACKSDSFDADCVRAQRWQVSC